MAQTKTKRKSTPPAPPPVPPTDRKRQWRLAFGMLFLVTGAYITLAIVSYFFTWQADQDKLIGNNFFGAAKSTFYNWCGELGAILSHTLVYRGAGIISILAGVWLSAIGLNLLYGKKVVPVMRYLRWFSILILIVAPILAYLMPHATFPYGGALGDQAIAFLNGFIGKAGTGMMLAGLALFLIFGIFALDISPLISRARRQAKALKQTLAAAKENTVDQQETSTGKSSQETSYKPLDITEEHKEDAYELVFSEKDAPAHPAQNGTSQLHINSPENTLQEKEETEIDTYDEGGEIELNIPAQVQKGKEEFSFEVIQQQEEEPIVKNGGHISIQSNEPYAPELDLPSYKFPTLDLLENRNETITLDKDELEKNKNQIISTLRSFGIEIQRISATVGPTVTLYEIVPAEGVRISKIRNLEDDIALNLAALGIRIIAPIPGKGTIGIEVPNANKQIVSMRALLSSDKFVNSKMGLPIAIGKKIDNENYIVDLATMPHLLMAGATGQGKSVGINAILVSLLYKKHPSQLKFVMVDPKKVELSIYKTIEKHFLAKLPNEEEAIITDTKKVIYTLNALCIEMDNRYELLKEAGARNIKEYNEKFISRKLNPQRGHKYLPFIVLVIDEFADLIMTAGKEVEMPIARLAQLARAIGIHLIIATQRPSVNVITGTIKANFPGRIAFKVSAKVDSRTILDVGGADQLVGRGDMLISHGSELLRVQCAFVDTPEVEKIVDFIGEQRGYPTAFELPEYEGEEEGNEKVVDLANRDKLFEDCAKVVVQTQSGSTSMLQRRFNLGYNRAGRIMDQLEAAGIVGGASGSKPREVFFHTESELEQFLNTLG
ncbi:MAG TPA: DNA translocase FtsK [Flavipsychrobacter sp.]|nr:DNA translocase FtsK [Flavipsychrobacter sp.]